MAVKFHLRTHPPLCKHPLTRSLISPSLVVLARQTTRLQAQPVPGMQYLRISSPKMLSPRQWQTRLLSDTLPIWILIYTAYAVGIKMPHNFEIRRP